MAQRHGQISSICSAVKDEEAGENRSLYTSQAIGSNVRTRAGTLTLGKEVFHASKRRVEQEIEATAQLVSKCGVVVTYMKNVGAWCFGMTYYRERNPAPGLVGSLPHSTRDWPRQTLLDFDARTHKTSISAS